MDEEIFIGISVNAMSENEIWRPVKYYEGLYEVSNLGRVRSLDYNRSGQIVVLKLRPREKGYLKAELRKNGKNKLFFVHRLVAWAFPEICGEWFEGAIVNHKNETTSDNRAENLEVCDCVYNNNYGNRNAAISRKMTNGKNSIPIIQLSMDGRFLKRWPSAMEVQREMNYYQSGISKCCNKQLSTAYGFKWMYEKDYLQAIDNAS